MSGMLISEIRRLYLLHGQQWHEQSTDGRRYYPAGSLTPAILKRQFRGEVTAALDLVSDSGLARAMVIDFDGVAHENGPAHWAALRRLYMAVPGELHLPSPAVSISGRKGYGLWFSLFDPVPAGSCRAFLHLLQEAYLSDIPNEELDLRPDADTSTGGAQVVVKLPPSLHRASGKWAAFIPAHVVEGDAPAPGLAAAPAPELQAAILTRVQSVSVADFWAALAALQTRFGGRLGNVENPLLEPCFDNAPAGFIAPCVAALVSKGVPEEMSYRTANVNLVAYCNLAGLDFGHAYQLAQQMAEESAAHPTTLKTVAAKVEDFESYSNRPFYCDNPRNMEAWRNLFGGLAACAKCAANPARESSHTVV